MGVLSWIILGLIAGALAKWLMPGNDGGGWIATICLGIAGALPTPSTDRTSTLAHSQY